MIEFEAEIASNCIKLHLGCSGSTFKIISAIMLEFEAEIAANLHITLVFIAFIGI